jgi:NAD(P)-dependent dehydrogenase (short-subunit alcohol dehydrogenase family)
VVREVADNVGDIEPRGEVGSHAAQGLRPAQPSRRLLGRAGTPDEVASVVAFLASADASFLTGETIEINGGMYMR